MSNNYFDVIIIGAGCSGLSAAKHMDDLKIKILERNDYIGGRVDSGKLKSYNIETGALFPIITGLWEKQITIKNHRGIKYITESGKVLTADTITKLLEIEDYDNLIEKYSSYTRPINEKLGLKVKNKNYGNLDILNKQQREIIEAVFQVTHCSKVQDCLKDIVPLTLNNITQPDLERCNQERLEEYFNSVRDKVDLKSKVVKIESVESDCKVKCINDGKFTTYKSKYVLVSSPPPEIFYCIEGINSESADFYSNIKYYPGSVCVLKIKGSIPDQHLLINTHKVWSACFMTIVDEDEFILHIYIPHCRCLVKNYKSLTIKAVYESIQDYLPINSKLEDGTIKHWDYLSPSLNNEMIKKYFPGHYKLTPRIWYCGELANFVSKNKYTYGTTSAMNSGKSVALELKQEINKNNGIRLNGLFNSEIYRITSHQPVYVRSRVDGNVAYYGVIASAYKERSIIDYLFNYQQNNQWEYHEKFGVTLEDSLLVIEGLMDAIGVPTARDLFKIEKYIDNYHLKENGLFTTVKNGCSKYWNGPSIVGNAHIIYIMKELSITDRRINKEAVLGYLLSRRRSNGLWQSKWFTNDFYTTFYVIRALLSENDTYPILNVEETISTFVQKMKIYRSSENCVISMLYIIRSLAVLLRNSRRARNEEKSHLNIIEVCKEYLNGLKNDDAKYSSETLLYYWQDVASNTEDNRIFITSKPNSKLINAIICITRRELLEINI